MNDKTYQNFVKQLQLKLRNNSKELLFLCIGTNKIIGDSFGPMVGTKLTKLNKNINILGNMNEPMGRININKKIEEIKKYQKEKYIIAIDSAISSKKENIGKIFITNSSMILGNGINKNILKIGDISIKAVVCQNFKVLEKVSKKTIDHLSAIVASGIYDTLYS